MNETFLVNQIYDFKSNKVLHFIFVSFYAVDSNISDLFFYSLGSNENVAFFAYMSQDLSSPSVAHILIFDMTPTDIGNHYNKYSGMFTAPRSGTYVFTWTIYCSVGGYVYEQLMVNAEVLDSSYCNADGAGWHRSISGTAVAQINQGDIVYVRTHPTSLNKGSILSSSSHRSSFAGWLLF